MPRGHPERESVEKIEALARRCRDITQKLLRFSQQRAEPDFRELDANRVVTESLALVEGTSAPRASPLDVSLAEPSPRVRGDPGHLAQVDPEPPLEREDGVRSAGPAPASGSRRGAIGATSRSSCATRGRGSPAENLPRIFEPFFTTKDQWSNVGLGLSISYRIVAEHGGRIDVESRAGRGEHVHGPAAGAVRRRRWRRRWA